MIDNTALLIIDVQIAPFMREQYDGKKVFKADELLKNILHLTQKARSSGIPVMYIQHTVNEDSIMGEGKPLWEIHPQIKPQADDFVFKKSHADSFYDTTLHQKLQALNINNLIITGIQTEFCVDTTCRRAFSMGYKNILVSNGHSTFDTDLIPAWQIIEHHNSVLGGKIPLSEKFAELKKTEEVVDLMVK